MGKANEQDVEVGGRRRKENRAERKEGRNE